MIIIHFDYDEIQDGQSHTLCKF